MAKVLKVRNANNTGWDVIASSIPDIPDISEFATIEYVDNEIENIDLSPYLTQSSASATYATQSYVDNELSNIDLTETINTASAAAVTYLVNGAPEALDTLNELAAALGDDENFATTVTNSLAGKQKTIPYQSSAPSSPSTGDLWVDSSTSTPSLKTYNGASWVQLGSAVDDTQAIFSGRMFI